MDGDLLLDKFQILYLAGALEVERLVHTTGLMAQGDRC